MVMTMNAQFGVIFALVTVECAIGIARYSQSVGVQGQLLCNGQPAKDVLVKLYEKHDFLDTLMDKGSSDSNGRFRLGGSSPQSRRITPVLNVYHDCNDGWKLCQRKLSFPIPSEYVSEGTTPTRFYNIGEFELSPLADGEQRDCFH
ncbi:Transthyretin-like protein 5 [Toxocara canis]|uniref:Transthyretin-like protein 5 n=1 Tax=Toxocara canis TaxID=6265 RepID=A0A0B2W5N0_TOXCA|nr:Transthyretin-like protein 5 [Toxocara canis]